MYRFHVLEGCHFIERGNRRGLKLLHQVIEVQGRVAENFFGQQVYIIEDM